ncbi:MAG: hypothetical protein HC888_01675 [Candidatus Competibacteraceae bacterium]|nr:hypothetical protein [Candidatus Competibacteraceae bacterium]
MMPYMMPLDIQQTIDMLNATNANAARAFQTMVEQNKGALTSEQVRDFAMSYFNGAEDGQEALGTTQNIGTSLQGFADQLENAEMNTPAKALSSVKAFNLKKMAGHSTLPPIDSDRFTTIRGLEGPFRMTNGRTVYYDPGEGKYYDRTTDMYLSDEESAALFQHSPSKKMAQAPFAPQGFFDDMGDAMGNEQMEMMGDQLEEQSQMLGKFMDHADLHQWLSSTDYRTARQALILPNDPSAEIVEDKLNDFYEHQMTPEEKLNVAEDIFNAMPTGLKGDTDSSTMIPAQYQQIRAAVKASEEAIKKLAQLKAVSTSKGFNLKKQAQRVATENVIMYGPEQTRFDPITRQPISDWHIIERNKGFGGDIDGVWNINWEAVWRRDVMDKFYRPYRDTETGEWVGGTIEKRFETDKWIPPENNYQLLPGQTRKPRLPQHGNLEARISHMRATEDREYGPMTDKTDPKDSTEADFNAIKLANSIAFKKAYEQSDWKKVYAMLGESNKLPQDDVQQRMMADVAYLRLVKSAQTVLKKKVG